MPDSEGTQRGAQPPQFIEAEEAFRRDAYGYKQKLGIETKPEEERQPKQPAPAEPTQPTQESQPSVQPVNPPVAEQTLQPAEKSAETTQNTTAKPPRTPAQGAPLTFEQTKQKQQEISEKAGALENATSEEVAKAQREAQTLKERIEQIVNNTENMTAKEVINLARHLDREQNLALAFGFINRALEARGMRWNNFNLGQILRENPKCMIEGSASQKSEKLRTILEDPNREQGEVQMVVVPVKKTIDKSSFLDKLTGKTHLVQEDTDEVQVLIFMNNSEKEDENIVITALTKQVNGVVQLPTMGVGSEGDTKGKYKGTGYYKVTSAAAIRKSFLYSTQNEKTNNTWEDRFIRGEMTIRQTNYQFFLESRDRVDINEYWRRRDAWLKNRPEHWVATENFKERMLALEGGYSEILQKLAADIEKIQIKTAELLTEHSKNTADTLIKNEGNLSILETLGFDTLMNHIESLRSHMTKEDFERVKKYFEEQWEKYKKDKENKKKTIERQTSQQQNVSTDFQKPDRRMVRERSSTPPPSEVKGAVGMATRGEETVLIENALKEFVGNSTFAKSVETNGLDATISDTIEAFRDLGYNDEELRAILKEAWNLELEKVTKTKNEKKGKNTKGLAAKG